MWENEWMIMFDKFEFFFFNHNNTDFILFLIFIIYYYFFVDNMDLLDEKVLKKHRPDLIEYMKVSYNVSFKAWWNVPIWTSEWFSYWALDCNVLSSIPPRRWILVVKIANHRVPLSLDPEFEIPNVIQIIIVRFALVSGNHIQPSIIRRRSCKIDRHQNGTI